MFAFRFYCILHNLPNSGPSELGLQCLYLSPKWVSSQKRVKTAQIYGEVQDMVTKCQQLPLLFVCFAVPLTLMNAI